MLSIGPPFETWRGDDVIASLSASGVTTGSDIITLHAQVPARLNSIQISLLHHSLSLYLLRTDAE